MQENILKRAYELGDLLRLVNSVTESYKENFHIDMTFLTEEEINCIKKIERLFSRCKIANFSSASKNEGITRNVTEILTRLINGNGESNLEQIRQTLNELKQQDEQNIKSFYLPPLISGLLALGGTLGCILMLILLPAIWPFVIFIAFVTLCSFALTGYLLKINADYKGEMLHSAWEDKFGSETEGVIGLLKILTQNDIDLLKKVNSEEWKNSFYNSRNILTERLNEKKRLANEEKSTNFGSFYSIPPEKNDPTSFNLSRNDSILSKNDILDSKKNNT